MHRRPRTHRRLLVMLCLMIPALATRCTRVEDADLPSRAAIEQEGWQGTPHQEFLESEIMAKYQCTTCHTVTGSGGTVGPILNQVGNRRDRDWIDRWISDPQAIKPGTKMPKFDFTEAEHEQVVDYLSRLRLGLSTGGILSSGDPSPEMGEQLFTDYDCLACHRVGREGRFVGPDLTWIGIRKEPAWESIWLADPDAWKPGTFMPDFHIPDEGIEALTAYLESLEGQRNEDAQEWEFNVNLFLRNGPERQGELVWNRFGCRGCHGVGAVGGLRNPNAAPSGEMPQLLDAANRYTLGEMRALLSDRQYPEVIDPGEPDPPFFCPDYGDAIDDREFEALYAYLTSLAPRQSRFGFR